MFIRIRVYSADDDWRVTYSSSHICALKDSTVTIHCTYTYPTGHKINTVFWTNTQTPTDNVFPDLSEDSEYKQRIQYLGDKQHDCSVRLTDVRHTDSHKYYFRFITNKPDGKWTGAPGVTLAVTDPPDKPVISISSSGVIVEGDSVNLTCSSESNPPVHIYSWFKENQTTSVGSGNIYNITNIRSDHSGQYKCKTRHTCGEKYSDPVTLNVLYPPRNVTVSISSSGVIVEGDSVTLTCSSESNPPVHIYSWFKEETSVGSGNIYRISNIRSDHSGQYKCKAGNEFGENNSTVTLNVLYPPRNVSASISSSGVIVEGDSVTLTCSSESNPPVHIYSWFKEETSVGSVLIYSWFKETQTSSVVSGQTFSISNINSCLSGWFYCVAHNKDGSQRSDAVSLTVKGVSSLSFSVSFGVELCVGVCGASAALLIVMFICRRKSLRRKASEHKPENDDVSNDTYNALDLKTRSSDLYDTLTVYGMLLMKLKRWTMVEMEQMLLVQVLNEESDIIYIKQLRGGRHPIDLNVSSDINNKLLKKETWKIKKEVLRKPTMHLASADINMMDVIGIIDTFDRPGDAYTEDTYARCGTHAVAFEDEPGKRLPKAGAQCEAGVGRARAEFSVFEAEAKGPNASAGAEASVGALGASAMARAEVASVCAKAGPVGVKVGLGVDTGVSVVSALALSGCETVRMAPPLPLILLLMIQGVYSADDDWDLTYSPSHICALKDSTVTINCTYTYPTGYQINTVFWTNTVRPKDQDSPDLFNDSEYKQRIQYVGDKQHDCSVRLTDVRHTDSHEYYFKFITDQDKWTGAPGVTLAVTDLQVESEGETVMEGHSVTLTCESTCSLTDTSTFIWFRNTHTLNERKKKLILPSVRRENAGDYSCAVQGHKLTSPPRRLHVFYPPDKPVISISSSGVIVEGDSVNLTCSSESNPPVHIYSWFKENQTSSVGSGQTFSITNINSCLSGWFYCVAQNKHGSQRSDAVSLTVKGVSCK
ncbi:B-cell receptor CD22-like [Triplophysa rosa]|uniref:B-cell receptor CD22-like n=1 Tax=Triplophysa rosa TaxID=992332 RepID=UPI002546078D|nr:B-cell receptor CD22-like [Triplophysa rosa]